ncbi:MAG TPA: sigma-70 family RNA polymerase sigma factor [Rhizomicrobium sp.]
MAPASAIKSWFLCEVLPLEASLMRFLQKSYRNRSELIDLRQDIYAELLKSAKIRIPEPTRPFVFAVARNQLIDRIRRERVIPIDTALEIGELEIAIDSPSPDRIVGARDELRRLNSAVDRLPARCREAVVLARIEGLSGREIAARMNISESAVSHYVKNGLRMLADVLYGASSGLGEQA